jgi:hypothetical protein
LVAGPSAPLAMSSLIVPMIEKPSGLLVPIVPDGPRRAQPTH